MQNKESSRTWPGILLTVSLTLVLVAGYRAARMYFLVGEFVVLSSHTECPSRRTCVKHYSVRTPYENAIDFVPFDDEFSEGALHDGATMVKRQLGFNYVVNGTAELWPCLTKQMILLLLGCAGIVVSVAKSVPRYLSRNRKPAAYTPPTV
jgi:hypothetical protein